MIDHVVEILNDHDGSYYLDCNDTHYHLDYVSLSFVVETGCYSSPSFYSLFPVSFRNAVDYGKDHCHVEN